MATTIVRPDPSLEESVRIQAFWNDHYQELLAEYPEKFVAVKEGSVVESNDHLAGLVDDLERSGLDIRTDVWIEFITARSASLLL